MFKCQECGRKFKTLKAAEKAVNDGCPKCGGCDIDIDTDPSKPAAKPKIKDGSPGPKSLSDLFRF